jgi:hypothetical protein
MFKKMFGLSVNTMLITYPQVFCDGFVTKPVIARIHVADSSRLRSSSSASLMPKPPRSVSGGGVIRLKMTGLPRVVTYSGNDDTLQTRGNAIGSGDSLTFDAQNHAAEED